LFRPYLDCTCGSELGIPPLFGAATPGWGRVQAICDFVHDHICFGYEHARATRTACEAYARRGLVADAHNERAIEARQRCMAIGRR
jgi:hypothetical protein